MKIRAERSVFSPFVLCTGRYYTSLSKNIIIENISSISDQKLTSSLRLEGIFVEKLAIIICSIVPF